ncbi:MAG: hypothetical protein WCI12_08005 [Actinomycetes bacterium]
MARRTRRAGRGSPGAIVAAVIVLLGLVALILNGVISAASSSSQYVELVNRSFATQANVIVTDQKPSGAEMTTLLRSGSTLSRLSLQQRLDRLSQVTLKDLEAARLAASPSPSDDLGKRFVDVIERRSRAVEEIRSAIDGLLGMAPLPVPGTPKGPEATPTPLLTSSEATTRLTEAGTLLLQADRAVGPLRAAMRRAPGHARIIRSVFIADHALLSAGSMASFEASLEDSPSLNVTHRLSLLTVLIEPSALPTSTTASTNLPPTRTMKVIAVVRNVGSVDEAGVRVTASLAPVSGGRAGSVSAIGDVGTGGAASFSLGPLRTTPGSTVTLTVSVAPPPGQVDQSGLSQSLTIVIAPATSSFR